MNSTGPAASIATPANIANRSRPQDRMISLFGLDVSDTTLEGAARWIVGRVHQAKLAQISFLNADCVNIMHRDPAYRDALEQSTRIFADGIGVRLAARLAGHELNDNVNGTDLFPVLCKHAANAQVGVFLFGAQEGRARAAGEAMRRENPSLNIAGCHHGYIKDAADEAGLIDAINASGAGILLVALGAPSQELWIARNRNRLRPTVIIGVGGLFDYYSGSVARAPLAIRQVGMEWAWRLAMEPKRLARRYLLGNAEFLMRIGITSVLLSKSS
ncbi:MAG: WecB/TagA/CpsF family glycosyltransferase [Hyphomicrobiaceae bacterium]